MKKERRYDIDWIRVIVFDFLIVYHVGMFFSPWDWHINNDIIVDWLQYPMIFVNQWRIPILFVVSGMGTRFALSHRSAKAYTKERFTRLFIPLLFGCLFIVPPQVYVERLSQGIAFSSYLDFYPHFFEPVYPNGNLSWHHLWFLPYLLLMSLLSTPLFLWLRKEGNVLIQTLSTLVQTQPFSLFLFIVPLLLVQWTLAAKYPSTHALIDDWYNVSFYSILFVYGFVLISLGQAFWTAVGRLKFPALLLGISCAATVLYGDLFYDHSLLSSVIKVVNCWSWILVIFGFAAAYLNKPSELIAKRNRAVYPFYIIHQTVTILIGYQLMNVSLHYSWKMLIMVIGTFGITWILYQIILRIKLLWPLFGLK